MASALLARAFDLAREAGCDRVDLVTKTDNFPAQERYNKAGFQQVTRVPFTKPM